MTAFDRDRASKTALEGIQRDVGSGLALAAGTVLGTPNPVHRRRRTGGYDPPTLMAALAP